MSGSREPRWRRYLRFHGRDISGDTNAELDFHFTERVRRYETSGMTPEEARRAASMKMGDLEAVRRECAREDRSAEARRRWRERFDRLWQDIRYGWRSLAKRPGFTCIAALTLALGVGATAGIFSIIDAILLRPLLYPTEDRIAAVWEIEPRNAAQWTAAPGKIADWRAQAGSFASLGYLYPGSVTLTGDGEPSQIAGIFASSEVATVFGVPPLIGRWFSPDEADADAPVAVLSHDLWMRRFGGLSDVLGRAIVLDGERRDVIGVMPRDYAPLRDADVWVPVGPLPDARQAHYLNVAALLEPGVSFEEAQAEMDVVTERLASAYPDSDADYGVELVPLREEILGEARPVLLAWLGAVGLVLLIGAANLANLLLARVSTRMPEMALRRSLGASGGRVIRQLLTENVLLAGVAGSIAIGLAVLVQRTILAFRPAGLPRLEEVGLDGRVVLVSLGLAMAGAIGAGMVPAWRLSRRSGAGLVGGVGRQAAGGIRRDRLMTALIVGEIGLAVVLTVGAGLLIQTLRELNAVDPGFATEDRVAFRVSLPGTRYEEDGDVRAFYRDLRLALESLPGVDAVGGSNGIPLEGVPWFQATSDRSDESGEPLGTPAPFRVVTPGYLEAAGIPLLSGRSLNERDRAGAPAVVVIERRLGETLFPGEDPIGRRVRISYGELIDAEVVGVVEDVRQYGLGSAATPGLYVPVDQVRWSAQTFVLEARVPLATLAPSIRQAVWALDANLPVYDLATMEERLADSLGDQRFRMTLLSAFAGLALLLGIVGVYGVVSYAVTQRSREIGIRLALGAGRGRVIASVVRWGAALGAVGIGLGVAGSLGLARLLEGETVFQGVLFGVEARDPAIFSVVGVATAVAVLAATWIPARRAAGLDPTETLRQE